MIGLQHAMHTDSSCLIKKEGTPSMKNLETPASRSNVARPGIEKPWSIPAACVAFPSIEVSSEVRISLYLEFVQITSLPKAEESAELASNDVSNCPSALLGGIVQGIRAELYLS